MNGFNARINFLFLHEQVTSPQSLSIKVFGQKFFLRNVLVGVGGHWVFPEKGFQLN